ncbi:MAG: SDR family NAD(P)-dependent oxidoreductase [Fidelibacterota bacterium]
MNILITGTSSGIGHGLAKEFIKRSANVWGISRRKVDDFAKAQNYHHLNLDLTDFERVKEEMPGFICQLKRFDLVILNAGVLGDIKWMKEISVAEMKRVMDINVWANKVLLDLLFKNIQEIKQVIGLSSKASLRSSPGWGPYSMSKAGLNMLMNIYSKEYPETHFNAFAPGLVDSEIQETIYNIKETDKYPTIKRLQESRYTEKMPEPDNAAAMLIAGMEKVLDYENGSFVDVREMQV